MGWPRDNQIDLTRFYGDPGKGQVERQLVKVVPPFQMYYEGRKLPYIRFHKKAAPALEAALTDIWEYVHHNQTILDEEGISNCAGTYNPRKVRGSANKWSNHAYGAAIDLDATANGLGQKGDMPKWVVAAFKKQGARWGGDYRGRKDPMHFEFCRDAEMPINLVDLPENDADSDPLPPPKHDVAPDASTDQPLWKRAWTWITGGGISLGTIGAGLWDYRAVIVISVVALVIFLVAWPTIKKKLEAM